MSGGSQTGQGDLFQQVCGGSNPTPPLQVSPKDLEVFRIPMSVADAFSIKNHYLHRTASNSKLAFGVKVRGQNELLGILIWGAPVARLSQGTLIELRRMYLPDSLPKNSESRVLSVCARIIHKLFPKVTHLISYSDEGVGHMGTIYKAAGWKLLTVVEPTKDGWGTHKRHIKSAFDMHRKRKWVYPLMCRTRKDTRKMFAKLSPKITVDNKSE